MKFENVLQMYWTKGFFYGGKLFYFNRNLDEVFDECPGLDTSFKKRLFNRFELYYYNRNVKNRYKMLNIVEKENKILITKPLNIMLSQINTVNNVVFDLKRLNILRLYLIQSYKGKCHALGKPVNGQRTWSNAWSSYKNNKDLRNFLSEVKKQIKKDDKPESKDLRLQKVVRVQKKFNPLVKKIKEKSIWF